MNEKALAYAGYWRNSVADADLGQGAFTKKQTHKFIAITKDEFQRGILSATLVEKFFSDKDDKTETVSIILRPKVYVYRLEHGNSRQNGIPNVITPLVCFADVSRKGRFYPSSEPVTPRDILEPLEAKSFSIGKVADLDTFLSNQPFQCMAFAGDEEELDASKYDSYWLNYVDHCQRMLEHVGNAWLADSSEFDVADYGYINETNVLKGPSRHVISLYDHLRKNESSSPLFNTYASEDVVAVEPCLSLNSFFSSRLAHGSDGFALADAQRDALCHALASDNGNVLAVNGPPGTGKTTLLLSLVASLWAKSALEGRHPPVILAASANNQAVKNVIDAFGKDFSPGTGPCAGRWLPDIKSYGAYFPSVNDERDVADKYQTRQFFNAIESKAYFEKAEAEFLLHAEIAFPNLLKTNTDTVVATLKKEIDTFSQLLKNIEMTWDKWVLVTQSVKAELGNNPQGKIARFQKKILSSTEKLSKLNQYCDKWEDYLADESIWYSLFFWFTPVKEKRMRIAQKFIKQHFLLVKLYKCAIGDVETFLQKRQRVKRRLLQMLNSRINKFETLLETEKQHLAAWKKVLFSLGFEEGKNMSLSDCESHVDQTIRFHIFRLTTHYWEGRWLLEMKALLPDPSKEKGKNGRVAHEKRWRRRMMITPCIVSTFYMLPKEMWVSKYSDNSFTDDGDYLYNFIDLLVVDEAGQILPELAGASFSLAKKALVIGDTAQIEPIRSFSSQVDIGNLLSATILSGTDVENDYGRISKLGKTAASGSVMRIAQSLSRYHYDPEMERGMFLYEHWRCYDDIIHFCNQLCYQNKLKPKRGSAPKNNDLPAMGYLHVDGICLTASGGSRYNLLEADTIAAWIAENRKALESGYKKGIDEIVCVITPFGRQGQAISRACRNKGIKVGKNSGEMVVGTVHSIQGAERPVVIFSSVYSKHADGTFIDDKNSLLNVAISRAKDHFLVFGDMDVFTALPLSKPRGLLASYLFDVETNALHFPHQPRRDLSSKAIMLRQLNNAQEHDSFLLDVIVQTKSELHIVTPWIRFQCMKDIGALTLMAEAAKRHVAVTVYTDLEFNTNAAKREAILEKRRALFSLIETLKEYGVQLSIVKRVHSKIVISDHELLCVGSFNWFSAVRNGRYALHETSLVYKGPHLKNEIQVLQLSLKNRQIDVSVQSKR